MSWFTAVDSAAKVEEDEGVAILSTSVTVVFSMVGVVWAFEPGPVLQAANKKSETRSANESTTNEYVVEYLFLLMSIPTFVGLLN